MGPLDYLATGTALAYVFLAARDNPLCWWFAAVSTACWGYLSYAVYGLPADALLQLFYFIMAGVGLWKWYRGGTDGEIDPVRRMTKREHAGVIFGATATGLVLLALIRWGDFATSLATGPDALTTTFSIATTFLLIDRKLENWLYWIVIDLVYVWIYWTQGAVFFAALMVVYVLMAVYGYRSWRTMLSTGV